MKKYSIFLAIVMLVLASLACQTIMGGGDVNVPIDDGGVEAPTLPPADGDGSDFSAGGESEFAMPGDAFNVVAANDVLTFQTKLTADEVTSFYRDEFGKQGYSEDSALSVTFGSNFTLVFTGHSSGRSIYLVGADAGDGSLFVTITLQ